MIEKDLLTILVTDSVQVESPVGKRVPEKSEMFDAVDSSTYINGCDFPETSDYAIVAAEIAEAFGQRGRIRGQIVEVCPGPGNLCGELLAIGAERVIGVDGDLVMLAHASNKFKDAVESGRMQFKLGLAQALPLTDDSVDGIVNFNSFHQFASEQRAQEALVEMARVLVPGGWGLVRDFKRGASQEAVNERLKHTKPEIVPLLLDSLQAAFTTEEFQRMLSGIPKIEFSIVDSQTPWRLPESVCGRIRRDPVEHWRDFGISQHVIIKKI